jgi:2,5-dihydroxypyridine 5,6-dioxygenase
MSDNSLEAVELFKQELTLCGVGPGQVVAVLAPYGSTQERAEGFLAAATALGADGYILTLPAPRAELYALDSNALSGRREAIEFVKSSANLVIDLVLLLFSPEQLELQAAGCRVLLVVEPTPILRRLLPNEDLKRRTLAAAEQLESASELRITSEAGTDVTYKLGAYPTLFEYGYTDEPGRWDHWPGGLVATHAHDDGVDGTIVLNTGDVLLLPVLRYVSEPITLHVEKGFITEIVSDSLDAMFVRDFFPDQSVDRNAWAISHVGWGLNREARWAVHDIPGIFGMDHRAFWGNVMISTGPNTEFPGGTRKTPFHLDIPMRGCSLYLDGELVVDGGRLAVPAQA